MRHVGLPDANPLVEAPELVYQSELLFLLA